MIVKQCATPGCPRYAMPGAARCEQCEREHRLAHWRSDDRPSAARRGYDSRWRRLRRMVLNEQPLCVRCLERGVVRLAEHVHHIRPLADGGDNRLENLMPLCRECHQREHALMAREGEGGVKSLGVLT